MSPEGECVVSHEGLALAHQEGAVGRPGLQAILRQQTLRDLTPVTSRAQLTVKPLLRYVLVHAVTDLKNTRTQEFNHTNAFTQKPLAKLPMVCFYRELGVGDIAIN